MAAPASTPSLPIIDISPFLPHSTSTTTTDSLREARQDTATAINNACRDYGFFYLTGHGIPQSTLDNVIDLARAFFNLPLDEKNKIKRYDAGSNGDGARGYQAMGENVTGGRRDMHEAVDWYREWDDRDRVDERGGERVKGAGGKGEGGYQVLQGPNLWPERPSQLKDVYLAYIAALQGVGEAVVRAMGQALGLPAVDSDGESNARKETDKKEDEEEDEEVFVRNTKRSFWVMRMIGYPPLPKPSAPTTGQREGNTEEHDEDVESFSCGAHTDYGCVTLLHADSTPGALQVLHKDGHTWINAEPIPCAFVVNIGDMMELWTNGSWKSTRHRVLHRGEGYRVSVPFFFEPNFDAVVRPLGNCVRECGGVRVGKEVVYGQHLLGKIGGNFYASGERGKEKA